MPLEDWQHRRITALVFIAVIIWLFWYAMLTAGPNGRPSFAGAGLAAPMGPPMWFVVACGRAIDPPCCASDTAAQIIAAGAGRALMMGLFIGPFVACGIWLVFNRREIAGFIMFPIAWFIWCAMGAMAVTGPV